MNELPKDMQDFYAALAASYNSGFSKGLKAVAEDARKVTTKKRTRLITFGARKVTKTGTKKRGRPFKNGHSPMTENAGE